jgi:flagellar protein FlbD
MDPLILLRRLGGPVFALNPDLIERAESTPDTVLTMVGGNKYVVCESLLEVTDMIREHRAQILAAAETLSIENVRMSSRSANTHTATARIHDISQHGHNQSGNSSVIPLRPKDS